MNSEEMEVGSREGFIGRWNVTVDFNDRNLVTLAVRADDMVDVFEIRSETPLSVHHSEQEDE